MDRRKFMKILGVGAAASAIPWKFSLKKGFQPGQAHAFAVSPGLKMFGTTTAPQPLRLVGPGAIPVAAIDNTAAPVTGIPNHYKINISEFQDTLHPSLGPTTLWGFNPANPLGGGTQPQKHLGGIIVATKGTPIQITFQNKLSDTGDSTGAALINPIPVDLTIPGAGAGALQNRTAIHLHGGHIPWISDGGPFDWFDHASTTGASFLNNSTLNPNALAGQAEYYYNVDQSARLVWYHDHAFGITRINAYAGIASALVIRDAFEANLVATYGLPQYIETSVLAPPAPVVELPIVFQDKVFVDPTTIAVTDPTWNLVARPDVQGSGSLWYAHVYDPKLYKLLNRGRTAPGLPNPSCVPEFFGDTMLVNGTVYPTATVEARPYRLRLLNACNARFMNLQLFIADATPDGITLNNKGVPKNLPYKWLGPEPVQPTRITTPGFNQAVAGTSQCLVIGNEGGFMPQPVAMPLNLPFNPVTFGGSLVMAPAERLDVVIDFTGYAPGTSFILYSDSPAPFPVGSPGNDFLPNKTGNGPNTREIMKFTVVAASTTVTAPQLPSNFAGQPPVSGDAWNDTLIYPNYLATGFPNETISSVTVNPTPRRLTLNENFDGYGRLLQMLGTDQVQPGATFGQPYTNQPTEQVANGTTEIWEIANLTGDTHPIHFHLVNVQILSRQAFDVKKYTGVPALIGLPLPPDPDERGWKETVRMHPGQVTRVAMTFKLAPIVKNDTTILGTPQSPRLLNSYKIQNGNEFVWHCHILEHEEHDMMRPLVVTGTI